MPEPTLSSRSLALSSTSESSWRGGQNLHRGCHRWHGGSSSKMPSMHPLLFLKSSAPLSVGEGQESHGHRRAVARHTFVLAGPTQLASCQVRRPFSGSERRRTCQHKFTREKTMP